MEETNFQPKYLEEIQKRYSKLDPSKSKDETVGVSVTDILLIPELHQHKLGYLLAEKYGGRTGILYPRDFVNLFSALSTVRPPKEKLKILFELLDVRRFGYIGGIELYRFYHVMLSPALDDKQIENVTKNAIKVCGEKIDFEKFQKCFPIWQVVEKMTVELQLTE